MGHPAEQVGIFRRIGIADRIGQIDRGGPRLDRGLYRTAQELAIAAGRVLGRPFNIIAKVAGMGHGTANGFQDLFRFHLQLMPHMQVAGGDHDMDTATGSGL